MLVHRLIVIVCALILGTAGCSDGRDSDSTSSTQSSREVKHVEIIKFVAHPALDDTERGIIDYLTSQSAAGGIEVRIERNNAKGSPQIAKQLAELASTGSTDLIVAIATPAAQAVARTPSEIPLVYGAVSDPVGAGILPSERATGIKNVGPNIIDHALKFIRLAFPDARTLGSIYNPAEQNSQYVQDLIKTFAPKYNFDYISNTVSGSTQVAAAVEALAVRADVIYSANDNTVNSAIGAVVAITRAARKPFVLGDLSTLESGALAAVGLEYYKMGRQVGALAGQILEGTPVVELPPRDAPEPEIWLNKAVEDELPKPITNQARKMVTNTLGGG